MGCLGMGEHRGGVFPTLSDHLPQRSYCMFIRHVTKTGVASIAALSAAGALTFFGTSLAGAAGPGNGSQVPGAAAAVAPFTPSTPFSSGQGINVAVPANTIFSPTTGHN